MQLNLKRHQKSKSNIRSFPETPGIYIFFEKSTPIYIGKAINLKRRVSSYFSKNIFGKTLAMVNSSTKISYIKTGSEFEAILLEAKLIKKYKPKYNAELKDDKNPIYITISKEDFPRIFLTRKPDTENGNTFGPFTSPLKVRKVLKSLRGIFPYATHKIGKKPCIYEQMGLCDPCPSYIGNLKNKKLKEKLTKEYLENIRSIKGVLSGRLKFVRRSLQRKMYKMSKKQFFETAEKIKSKIDLLDYITHQKQGIDEYLLNPNFYEDIRKKEREELEILLNSYFVIKKIKKVECYDVSHIAGEASAASMVMFLNGEPYKKYYRRFKVRGKTKADDIKALDEIIKRRIKHLDDWGKPDLIIVDGGKPQVKIFNDSLKAHGIPVIGIAKRNETLVILNKNKFYEKILANGYAKNFLIRIRDESHRFAKKYHKHLFTKSLIKNYK
jgi:excinuclease ABC subunit C